MLSADSTKSIASSSSHQYLSSASAEKIANNDDLLIEILVCLPINSLVKFKAVSKHWLSLISNPNFSLRLNLIPRPISALILLLKYSPKNLCQKRPRTDSNYELTKYDLINLNSDPSHLLFKGLTFASGTIVLQSCNGLLLCGNFNWHNPNHHCFICNPITKRHIKLPHIIGSSTTSIFGINLVFDPLKSPHYKVVCVRSCDSLVEGHYQIEIYSSETNGPWRLSGGTFSAPHYMNFKEGVFWNGALHWINFLGASFYFNVAEETLRKMPMPDIPDGFILRKFFYFGESRGHLHLIEVYRPCTMFNVHEMQRDYSGWFVKYHVDLREVVTAYPEMAISNCYTRDLYNYRYSILCVVREENDEDSYMVLHVPRKAVCYNFKDKTFKELRDFAPATVGTRTKFHNVLDFGRRANFHNLLEHKSGWFDAFQYTESLACV